MSTIPRFFLDRVAQTPDVRAFSAFVDGQWRESTWRDYERMARGFGLGLVASGLRRGDAVAVLGETGAKIAPILPKLPRLERIVVWRCDAEARAVDPRVESLDEAIARGEALHAGHPSAWTEACLAAKPADVALLIYTSGTTGQPKGAMITHRNIDAQTTAIAATLPWSDADSGLSFLPMAHAAERCLGHYNRIRLGIPTHYARSIATLLEDMEIARPTMFGSPRGGRPRDPVRDIRTRRLRAVMASRRRRARMARGARRLQPARQRRHRGRRRQR